MSEKPLISTPRTLKSAAAVSTTGSILPMTRRFREPAIDSDRPTDTTRPRSIRYIWHSKVGDDSTLNRPARCSRPVCWHSRRSSYEFIKVPRAVPLPDGSAQQNCRRDAQRLAVRIGLIDEHYFGRVDRRPIREQPQPRCCCPTRRMIRCPKIPSSRYHSASACRRDRSAWEPLSANRCRRSPCRCARCCR